MKKKLVTIIAVFSLCFSNVFPALSADAETVRRCNTYFPSYDYFEEKQKEEGSEIFGLGADTYDYEECDENEEISAQPIGLGDIMVTPAKKTIRIGFSFYINVVPIDEEEWEYYSDSDFEELCALSIDSIEYQSNNASVASVNRKSGKVKARHKGSAVIRTGINFSNGDLMVYKTKVYVTK